MTVTCNAAGLQINAYFISRMSISPPNPLFGHLLESSHRDDSNKWSNMGFGDEITQVVSIEINFRHLIRALRNII